MGKFDQLRRTIGTKPRPAPVLAKANGDETREQLRARLAAPKKRAVVLAKAVPTDGLNRPLPRDVVELRRELDEAVSAGKITGTDARDICHQLAAGQILPDDLAVKLAAILKTKPKAHSYDDQKRTPEMKAELLKDLALAVKGKKITAAQAAKAEHLLNVGAELTDDLKVLLWRHTR
ncbi:hypothetical protein [Pseudomonas fluorescens]|uniref:Uncharacterized protein n=1 Tax=Pseudomonas fluorescens TaxID=294 RepID=A0A4Y9TEU0_PSEFL|nr:hypothetical protein [Pseudomonas fluorescens]TFW40909.1 hypothetical protein E4T65_23980 [Pseudomonas fluorescens]